MKEQTEEEGRKVWREIFKSEMKIEKYKNRTYITYLGMLLKLWNGKTYSFNRKTKKWVVVDPLTLQPIKPKCEKKFIDRSEGYEKYGT